MKFKKIDSDTVWVICASAGLIGVCLVFMVLMLGLRNEQNERCEQAGGVPVKARRESILNVVCVNRSAVINYEEQSR